MPIVKRLSLHSAHKSKHERLVPLMNVREETGADVLCDVTRPWRPLHSTH